MDKATILYSFLKHDVDGDSLIMIYQEEAVPESLKNILLVMVDGGYLMPPSENANNSEIWDETWKRVDRFLPGLYKEIYPEASSSAGLAPTETSQKTPPLNKESSGKPEKGNESSASVFN